MTDLRELYQEVILDHSKRPRNYQCLENANRCAEGHNPLCGDHITIYLEMDGERVRDVSFQGTGCAISKASASMMTAAVKEKTRAEVEALFQEFHRLVTAGPEATTNPDALGKLAVFSGVFEFPVRVKCASLPWHTLRAAIEGRSDAVSTE